jgi:hypothetical protein
MCGTFSPGGKSRKDVSMGLLVMAKKKAPQAKTKATIGTPKAGRKAIAAVVKGGPEWKEWLEQAAAHDRLSVSAFLDRAAAHYAKAIGFPKAPPERNG